MKKKVKNKISNEKVSLTKSLAELMKDEDGFVSKETILKVGLSTIAMLGMVNAMSPPGEAHHVNSDPVHTNTTSTGMNASCPTHTNSWTAHYSGC